MEQSKESSSEINLNSSDSSIASYISNSSIEFPLLAVNQEGIVSLVEDVHLQDTQNQRAAELTDSGSEKDVNANLVEGKPRKKPKFLHKEFAERFRALHNSPIRVYYAFTGFFGWGRSTSKKVHFSQETINQYEAKGDIAGKDRFVPRSKQPYRKPKTRKKTGSLVIAISKDFEPRIERIEDETQLGSFCERKFIGCECFKKCRSEVKESPEATEARKKVKLSDVTEGFLYDVTVAEAFILGHRTTTFAVAVQAMDIPSTVELQKAALSSEFMKAGTLLNAKLSRSRFGLLATNIWIFAYCIPLLFENDASPSESSFWDLMEQFGQLASLVEEETSTLLAQSISFYNFAQECMRIISILQLKLDFEGDTVINEPLSRGRGLQLIKIKSYKLAKKPLVTVQLGKLVSEGNISKWTDFLNVSDSERIQALRHLLNLTSEGHALAQLQIRFLVDDVVESTSDLMNETDILFTLADMYDRISFMEAQPDTIQKETELAVLRKTMSQFTSSLHNFILTSQHMLEKAMELRDMIQVSCRFFQDECKIKLTPRIIPEAVYQTWGLGNCCGCGSSGEYYMPRYKPTDLFRTYYEDSTKVPFLPAETVFFNLEESATEKMKHPGRGLTMRFIKSIPNTPLVLSTSEIVGTMSIEDMASKSDQHVSEEPILKPILVKASLSEDALLPARASIDIGESLQSISSQASVLENKQGPHEGDTEEDDEPIERAGLVHMNSITKLKKHKANKSRKK